MCDLYWDISVPVINLKSLTLIQIPGQALFPTLTKGNLSEDNFIVEEHIENKR